MFGKVAKISPIVQEDREGFKVVGLDPKVRLDSRGSKRMTICGSNLTALLLLLRVSGVPALSKTRSRSSASNSLFQNI